jgi:hypothetical protein
MRGPIERRHGLAAGILVNGTMFGLLQFPNYPGAVLAMLPYYIAVAAVSAASFGRRIQSCRRWHFMPAVALHAGGDIWSLTRLWAPGLPEWQLSATPRPPMDAAGVATHFFANTAAFVVLSALFVMLARRLHRFEIPRAAALGLSSTVE